MIDMDVTDCAVSTARNAYLQSVFAGLLLPIFLMVVSLGAVHAQPNRPAVVYIGFGPASDGISQETQLTADTPTLTGKTPVLFVHGHNLESSSDSDFNFRKNWQQPLSSLTSFKETLEHGDNAGLEIEPYFIRFVDQDRSIVEDAKDIEWAVEHILKRHDASHVPFTPTPTTTARVAIIGYSKGTISSRCYLKSFQPAPEEPGPCNFGVPRNGFNPVSEFVAIAPPNHGLAANLLTLVPVAGLSVLNSLSLKQLNDGYKYNCDEFTNQFAQSQYFIQRLNGHSTTDSQRDGSQPWDWVPGPFNDEAPGSRLNGSNSSTGTLYLSLYSSGTSISHNFAPGDPVGGHYPSDDCRGRKLARNLADHAENIEVSQIPGPNPTDVHKNTVHMPRVICLALYAVSHHNFPTPPESVACETDGQVPLVPLPPPWWWVIILILLSFLVVSIVVVVLYLKPSDG